MTIIRNVADERRKTANGDDKNYYDTVINQIDSLNTKLVPSIYVSSFCESGDELALWRGYCPHSSGYALGYNWNQDMDQQSVIAKCIYDDEQIVRCIEEELDKYLRMDTRETRKKYSNTNVPKNLPEYAWRSIAFVERMYYFSSAFKNKSFKEEREWRLIIIHPTYDLSKEKYRTGETMIIPYIEHSMLNNGELNIDEIVIEPTNHPIHAAHAIERYIVRFGTDGSQTKVNCNKVSLSKIPYRKV